jgi:hypothetical protein
VTIKGGYAGFGEPNSNARDFNQYQAVLSGDLDGNDTDVNQPEELFSDANRGDNSYHVVVASEVDGNAVLDGFTITGGYANGPDEDGFGGGMLCSIAEPKVLNCTFAMNAAGEGGGMANWGGHPVVTGCTFGANAAEVGGGMYNEWVNPLVAITNCSFVGNLAMDGGAVANFMTDSAMTNCRFSGNAAVYWGGAVYNAESNSLMTNCTFGGNYASEEPGGAVFDFDGGQLELSNCILWCDAAADGNEIAVADSSTVDVNYCDVKGGEGDVFIDGGTVNWGPGNMQSDPCFVAPGYWGDVNDTNTPVEPDDPNAVWVDGDYRLLAGSPCVDAGDNNSLPADIYDLDGDGNTTEPIPFDLDANSRILDGNNDGYALVDMGAYEAEAPPIVDVPMKFTPQALNPCSKGKVYAHFDWPQGSVEGQVTDTPATLKLLGTEVVEVVSEDIEVVAEAHGLVRVKIAFWRADLCGFTTDDEDAEVEVIVTGTLSSGQQFRGTDTIKINDRRLPATHGSVSRPTWQVRTPKAGSRRQ